MFAFGGLESAFVWIFLLGMFWKRANKTGAILSMVGGTVSYCVTMALGVEVMHLHQIVIGISVSLVLMILGSKLGRPAAPDVLKEYF